MADVNAAFKAAVAKHQAGDAAGAEQAYRTVLKSHPGHAPSLCNLGVLLAKAGKTDEAASCYNLALASTPNYADAHFNLGNLYRRSGQLRLAADNYQACLAAQPHHASAQYNLGLVLAAAGELSAAADCYRAVCQLEPTNADAFGRLGDVLVRCGQVAEGVTAFRKAVELKPNDPRALYNLGLALSNAGQVADAHECVQKALQLNPDYAEAHNALGLNLEALGRKDDALFHYQKAVELKPDLADAWSNLGTNLAEQGRAEDAIECLRESLVHRPNAPPIHSNLLLLLNYSSRLTPDAVFAEHKVWADKFAGPTPDRPPIPLPHDPDRRLRVGYLSADFRTHTVAGFIATLLTHHDRSRVEVYCYPQVLRPDDTTERLRTLADHWRPVSGLTDEPAADLIRRDKLDVLIDLSGHTAGNRLGVLAHRPAPVQCLLFGYPNTTGIPAVDYRITDPVSDPPGMTESLSVERPLRLPDLPWVYAPPATAPDVTPLPAAGQRKFTFGCLNNPAKISDSCLETWVTLLQTIPGTRLVLLGGQSQAGAKRLTDRFAKAGVLRDRVEVVMRLPKERYYQAYGQFDLCLDPFPYNGGVTTADALWMGVPVLTVAGSSYVSRQGLAVMAAVGLPEFVADTPATLLRLAKEWTQRRAELADIRAGLRERVAASPLADAPRYVRNLEASLRSVWLEWLQS
jgi:predicted O-linked N-acetylglucosamine transferase (SPINDLY family)